MTNRQATNSIQGPKGNKDVMENALNNFGDELTKARKTMTPEAYQKLMKQLDEYVTFKEQGN